MLAFTFPGQGSQKQGMGRAWVDHPSWEIVADASDAADRDLAHLLLEADDAELKHTRNSQLATFTLSLVVLDAVERMGVEPAAVAGHSLGEYTALVASGVIGFEDGVRVVAERGEAMQAASEDQPGTMAAILGVDADVVDAACRRAESDVWLANDNAPGQIVIAGSPEGIEAAGAIAKELGAKKVMPLPVGGAFHSPFMTSARNRLRKALKEATFRDPEVPVTANVDAHPHADGAEWPSLLSAQLISPVRWRPSLLQLAASGIDVFLELGPGNVLTGMAKRTVDGARTINVSTPEHLEDLLEAIAPKGPMQAYVHEHHGEQLYVSERLVIAHSTGIFQPAEGREATPTEGELVDVGALIGVVGDEEVRSPFAGLLMGTLVLPGERVSAGQPVAWLRAS